MSVAGRRAQLTATLSSPSDNGLIVPGDVGWRLAGVVLSSQMNAGFYQMSATVLSRGGTEQMLDDEAGAIWEQWRLGVLRLYLQGELAWVGRLWQPTVGQRREDPTSGLTAIARIEGEGPYFELTNHFVNPESGVTDAASVSATDDQPTISASALIRETVALYGGPLLRDVSRVLDSGVNVGVNASYTDAPLDLITTAVQAGTPTGDQGQWGGDEIGAYYRLRGSGAIRWAPRMAEVEITRDDRELVTDCRAMYTDADQNAGITDVASNAGLIARLGGFRRQRTISAGQVGKDGANAARDTFLALHADPWSVAPLHISAEAQGRDFPHLEGPQGGLEPAWRVRAGDLVDLTGLLPFDPFIGQATNSGRLLGVEAVHIDVDAGTAEIQLDTARMRSRPAEQAGYLSRLVRDLEPAMSRKLRAQAKDSSSQTALNVTDTQLLPTLTFTLTRRTVVHINVQAQVRINTTTGGEINIGYTLDGEPWDRANTDVMRKGAWAGQANDRNMPDASFGRLLAPGTYRIDPWIYQASTVTATVEVCRVRVRG